MIKCLNYHFLCLYVSYSFQVKILPPLGTFHGQLPFPWLVAVFTRLKLSLSCVYSQRRYPLSSCSTLYSCTLRDLGSIRSSRRRCGRSHCAPYRRKCTAVELARDRRLLQTSGLQAANHSGIRLTRHDLSG